jgi:hypothetical protein
MSSSHDAVWRAALEMKGADWVVRDYGPGMANQGMRSSAWFTTHRIQRGDFANGGFEQENRAFSMSPTTIGIMVSVVLVLVFTTMAISAFEKRTVFNQPGGGAATAASGGANNQVDNTVPLQNQGPTIRTSKPLLSCACTTYSTANCKTSAY